jgi:membrane-associated protein
MDLLISLIHQLFDFLHHIPEYLRFWADNYGTGLYIILALIIFCETGLVFTPFLPGDSLLFAAGALLALNIEGLNLGTMCVVLSLAAICGDLLNYHVGKWMGSRLFKSYDSKLLNKKHLDRTREFYARHGGKTIIFARFMPIIRTYAPFVAGLSGMKFVLFFSFSVAGGIFWITSFLTLGYFFGNLPAIQSNFHYVILAIIVVSLLPMVFEFLRARRHSAI